MPIFWLRGVKKELCLPVSFLIVSAGFLILSASAIRLSADSLIVSVDVLILPVLENGRANRNLYERSSMLAFFGAEK